MSKEIAVIALGVWITMVPYLGVPGSWRAVLLVISGALLVVLGFFLRAEAISRGGRPNSHHTFVENGHDDEESFPHSPHPHERKERITSLN